MGRTAGVTEEQLMALPDFETSTAFTDLEKLVLRYSAAMTNTPVEVSDELFAALHRHFDERQLVELTSAIAWENYRARFDHAFGIQAEGFYRGALCLLPQRETRNEKRETRNVLTFFIEVQRSRIHAVAQTGGRGSVFKDMPEMRAAFVAHYLNAPHSVGGVRLGTDALRSDGR